MARWATSHPTEGLFTSVLVLGEIRQGIERARRRDAAKALVLDRWLESVRLAFEGRILPIDQAVAEEWGRTGAPDPIPVIDGLLATTAKVNGLTLATRNIADLARTGAHVFNPFEAAKA